MATCPNKNLDSWNNLVTARGEDVAYYLWDKYDGNVPESESKSSIVKAGLKSVNALQSDKAVQVFSTLQKNKVAGEAFWNKIQSDLQIPKDQIDLLKKYNTTDREQLIANMLGDYSYAVEINLALDKVDLEEWGDKTPSEYYSSLTVPGGTNYTENEIATPAITPSIKGHAQFATDKGIGWFRSDDKTIPLNDYYKSDYIKSEGRQAALPTKTRRILEVQSDLFQKGRDKQLLISDNYNKDDIFQSKEFKEANEGDIINISNSNGIVTRILKTSNAGFKNLDFNNNVASKENQFLQLLNKANNWVTFFIKSIIQDSAKKGYEKVLFPSGNTASKVEGQESLEEFKQLKESSIFQLQESNKEIKTAISNPKYDAASNRYYIPGRGISSYSSKDEFLKSLREQLDKNNKEIEQLKQELERVEKEGFGALKPIYNFYENTVANVLKKQGYAPKQVTDEYGNTWNEVSLKKERDTQKILFQTGEVSMSAASKETLNKVKEAAKKMGISIQDLADYAKSNPEIDTKSVNGVADLVRGVIAVAVGKEDVALTEEMVHLATAILEQTNPKLVTEMISKIDRFKIYKQTLEAYKNNKAYQLPNGKPDIRKIKKEAVDKLIAEVIINKNEGSTDFPELMQEENQSWVRRAWNSVLDAIRSTYKAANISIFEEVAEKIIQGEVGGTVKMIKGDGVFLQAVTDKQQDALNKLKDRANNIEKVVEEKSIDPLLSDSEEASNFYRMKNAAGEWSVITKRVTDRVKAWYRGIFGQKEFSEQEKAFNELKRKFGVAGHADLEGIHARYYNEDGTRKEKPDDAPTKFKLESKDMYDMLEKYYVELINTFPKDTLILSEQIIYDTKEKEAGTIDFLAIEPSGKAHILDWKFMTNQGEDVAWYKQGAYDVQLRRYKEILRDNYGIKEFGKMRAIPILLDIKQKDPKVPNSEKYLSGIAIGSVDPTKITDIRLLPVSEKTESTGNEVLDKVLGDLEAVLSKISDEKVTSEEERLLKKQELLILQKAIRLARGKTDLAPLIDIIQTLQQKGERILNDYNAIYKNKPATSVDVNDTTLSDFSEEMLDYIEISDVFVNIDRQLGDLIYKKEWRKDAKTKEEQELLDQREQILNRLRDQTDSIFNSNTEIKKARLDFADKHIGQRNLTTGLTKAGKVIKGFFSRFRGISELPNAALQLLFKLTTRAKGLANAESFQEVKELMDIRERLAKRGGSLRNLVKTIYQKDEKGAFVNKLIYKYSKEFTDKINAMAEEGGDKQWLRDNIDMEKYKKDALEVMNQRIERIKNNHPNDPDLRDKLILEEYRRWDIERKDFNGWSTGNYILKRYPLDKWFSKEYLAVKADPDMLDLYNFITKINEKANEVGYIDNMVYRTFLPFVRKSMAEELAWDGSLSIMKNFQDSLTMHPDDVGYGKYNSLTGELLHGIPKYYTHDFSKTEDGVNDYSEVSEDLFKNMILYLQHVNKYKYLSQVEGQVKIVKDIEEFKGHLRTNKIGDVVRDAAGNPIEEAGNKENAALFDAFMRTLLYDQKYSLSDEDAALGIGKPINEIKKLINKIAGKEVLTVNDNPASMIKTIDAANRAFQLKTLGFEFISGAVNFFGGNMQALTQAGHYFKGGEFTKNEAFLLSTVASSSEEKQMFRQLVDVFMPLKDDPSYEMMKKSGMIVGTRRSFSDDLMVFMRMPEQLIEKTIFLSLLDNMMVEDGKIISIREFVKSKYKNRGDSAAAFREANEKIEKEVEELKKTRSISKTKKMENGKLVIPGLDLNNTEEILRLTGLTRRIARNATGGISDGDINQMQMNVWTKSMMVFKNWIPKLTETRFGEFRKVSDDFSVIINEDGKIEGEKYDIGRLRLLGYVLNSFLAPRLGRLNDMLVLNDKGMEAYREMYEVYKTKYEQETGEVMNMEFADFVDMTRRNLQNQVREILILLSLVGAGFAMGFMGPPEDADKATKNRFRFYQKVIDKFTSELSFFYNPANFESLLSGSIFPAVGLIKDIGKFFTAMWLETTGLDLSDPTKSYDDVVKDAHPIKYGMKIFPFTKSLVTYLSILDSDFAKEHDVTIQKESNRR